MIAALFQQEDEGVIFHSVVGAASAAGRTLGDVRALAGQSTAGGPKVRTMYPAPTTARTVFGVGRGPTLQRGQLYDDVNTREHLQRGCRVTFKAMKVMADGVRILLPVRGDPNRTGHDLQPVRCFVDDVHFYVPGQDLRASRGIPDDSGQVLRPARVNPDYPESDMQPMMSLSSNGPAVTRPVSERIARLLGRPGLEPLPEVVPRDVRTLWSK